MAKPTKPDPRLEQYRPMVRMLAKRFYFRSKLHQNLELQDVEAVAMEALWGASQRFDPERGVSFSSYAYGCITRRLVQLKQVHSRGLHRLGRVSLSFAGPTDEEDEGDALELESPWRQPDELADTARRAAALLPLLGAMPALQREVIRRRFGLDQTLREAGDALRLSRERVRQIEARAIDHLRARIRELALTKSSRWAKKSRDELA